MTDYYINLEDITTQDELYRRVLWVMAVFMAVEREAEVAS